MGRNGRGRAASIKESRTDEPEDGPQDALKEAGLPVECRIM